MSEVERPDNLRERVRALRATVQERAERHAGAGDMWLDENPDASLHQFGAGVLTGVLADLDAILSTTEAEAASEEEAKLYVDEIEQPCRACSGSGMRGPEGGTCGACKGSGVEWVKVRGKSLPAEIERLRTRIEELEGALREIATEYDTSPDGARMAYEYAASLISDQPQEDEDA